MAASAGRKTDCNTAGKTPREKFFQRAVRCERSCSGVFPGADGGKERFFACAGISAACLLCVCAATIGQSSRSGDALKPLRQPEALRSMGVFCRRNLRGRRSVPLFPAGAVRDEERPGRARNALPCELPTADAGASPGKRRLMSRRRKKTAGRSVRSAFSARGKRFFCRRAANPSGWRGAGRREAGAQGNFNGRSPGSPPVLLRAGRHAKERMPQ